ncbi:uncharacterized protein [Argopecten irradians]|uniref:uncharacterized protein n=1 Tax=Argopecten irradians TaxID=31199 RepID=UPI00371429D6
MRTNSFSNKYLSGSGYITLSPFGYQQCISRCMVSRECQSINYDLGHLNCELNTETTQTATSLTDKIGNVFKDMKDTPFPTPMPGNCQKTTCPNYHACVVLSAGNAACIEPVPGAESTSVPTPTTTESVPDAETTTVSTPTTTEFVPGAETTTVPTSTTTESVPDAETTTVPAPTTTANACVYPYTLTSGLCLYLGGSDIWNSVYTTACPGTSRRLFITDTAHKRGIAAMLCPTGESCWLGGHFGEDGQCYWSNGNSCYFDQRGSGYCLRVVDNTFKGGYCGNEFSYICEQL